MRILIKVESDERYEGPDFEFFIEDFPDRLNAKDTLSLDEMMPADGLTDTQRKQCINLIHIVDSVHWQKGENGFWMQAFCLPLE